MGTVRNIKSVEGEKREPSRGVHKECGTIIAVNIFILVPGRNEDVIGSRKV
jgi:hypothetical protein